MRVICINNKRRNNCLAVDHLITLHKIYHGEYLNEHEHSKFIEITCDDGRTFEFYADRFRVLNDIPESITVL